MATLVSQYAYARHRGISKQAVSKAVREGRIPLVNGKIPLEEADQLAIWTRPPTAPRTGRRRSKRPNDPEPNGSPESDGDGEGLSLHRARVVRESWRARRERLEYERRSGALVAAAEVRIKAFEAARRARDLLLLLPDRLAPVLAERPEAECHELLRQEVHALCAELGKLGKKE